LSVQQQGEIAMLLIFPVLKSIEKATASKSSFAELSNHFLDHLFSNEGGYGLDESIKGYVLPNLNRLGEYENTDMEEIHSLFYEKIDSPHSSNNAEMAEIVQMNFVITAKEAKKIIDK
jgi:hypothetical protein